MVVHVDNHSVANSSLDSRQGPLSVDPDYRPVEETVRISSDPTHIEVVGTGFGVNQRKQGEYVTYVEEI